MKLASMEINLKSQALSLNLPSGLLWGTASLQTLRTGTFRNQLLLGQQEVDKMWGKEGYLDKPHLLWALDTKSKMEARDPREHHSFSSSSCNPGWR